MASLTLDQPFSHISVWRKVVAKAAMRVLLDLETWAERKRTRNSLAALDDRMLADLGLSRAEAQTEAEKPAWKK